MRSTGHACRPSILAAVGAAVLLALPCVGRAARANDPPGVAPAPVAPDGPVEEAEIRKRAEGIANELWKNHPYNALDLFTDPAILDIAGAPRAATSICRAALVRAQRIEAKAESAVEKLIERLGELTESMTYRTDGGPLYDRAIGFGRLAIAVHSGLRGKIQSVDAWRAAFAAARKPGPGEPLTAAESVAALSSLVLAGARHGLELAAWEYLALELAAFADGKQGDPEAKRLAVWVDLERGILLARRDVEAANAHLARAIPILASADGLDPSNERMVGRYNAGLSAAREAGLTVVAEYRAPAFLLRWGWLGTRVPAGTGWRLENATEGDRQMSTFERVRTGRDRITIRFDAYGWAKAADGSAKKGPVTDVTDDLIETTYPVRASRFAKVTKASKSLTGPLSKAFPVSKGYEVRGAKADGTPLRVRDWYLRSTSPAKWTFVVSVEQEGAFAESDPELATILDALHEVGGTK
jgi:hypothetical protein